MVDSLLTMLTIYKNTNAVNKIKKKMFNNIILI